MSNLETAKKAVNDKAARIAFYQGRLTSYVLHNQRSNAETAYGLLMLYGATECGPGQLKSINPQIDPFDYKKLKTIIDQTPYE